MRSIYILLILLFFAVTLSSQAFAPLGSNWKIRGWVDISDYPNECEITNCIGNFKHLVSEDTIHIDGRKCSVIRLYAGPTKADLANTGKEVIVYEEEGKVYFYYQDEFHLMLDFNLQVGNTLEFFAPGDYSAFSTSDYWTGYDSYNLISGSAVVEERNIIQIDGLDRIELKYTGFFSGQDTVILWRSIEGIGNIGGFFGEAPFLIAEGCHGQLLCYEDDDFTFTTFDNCECEFQDAYTGLSDPESANFSIYPNPAGNTLTILSEGGVQSVRILNLNGRELMTSGASEMIDISRLINGLLFIEIHFKNGSKYLDRIVKL